MTKRALIVVFFVLLFVLHQDFWWKNDPSLVLGVRTLLSGLDYAGFEDIGWQVVVPLPEPAVSALLALAVLARVRIRRR